MGRHRRAVVAGEIEGCLGDLLRRRVRPQRHERVKHLGRLFQRRAGPHSDALWRSVYRDLETAAPAIPLVNRRSIALVSKRIGNYEPHPLWTPTRSRLLPFAHCDKGQAVVGLLYLARRTRTARPRLGRGATCLADERGRRKRARSVADAAPNVRRSTGPSDPSVSSTGMPAMCASGITGRSPWCSRRPGGAPRGRGLGRWGGRGSRRRSRGRPPSRRRASS
jgi:hypothetical protein